MGFAFKGEAQGDAEGGESPPRPQQASRGTLSAFIDQGSEFEGKLSFRDTVRIDGKFTGEISSENTLIIGETAEIHANARSKTVHVGGTVIGDIVATEKLVLHKTAHIEGNVETVRLVVEDGAQLNGNVVMAATAKKDAARSEPPKS